MVRDELNYLKARGVFSDFSEPAGLDGVIACCVLADQLAGKAAACFLCLSASVLAFGSHNQPVGAQMCYIHRHSHLGKLTCLLKMQ